MREVERRGTGVTMFGAWPTASQSRPADARTARPTDTLRMKLRAIHPAVRRFETSFVKKRVKATLAFPIEEPDVSGNGISSQRIR